MQPPLQPGQTLDPNSMYAQRWPGKPALVKINEQLILAIPPQFHKFWAHRHPLTGRDESIRPPFPVEKLKVVESAGFTMHLPDYEGYRPDNYLVDFDQNRVEIVTIASASMKAMEPDAPGAYPPNMFKRVSIGQFRSFDPDKYEERYGLNCYDRLKADDEQQYCYGKRESDSDEYLLLDVMFPPYASWIKFPLMRTHYFSPKYGGIEIAWRSHMNNFPQWRDIDAQIWKYLDAWNIAPKTTSPVSSQAPTSR